MFRKAIAAVLMWLSKAVSRDTPRPMPLSYHKLTCGVYSPYGRACDCGAGALVPKDTPWSI